MKGAALSQERLKECLQYDSDTGVFTWLVNPCRNLRVGSVAGTVRHDGYVVIMIDRKLYLAHRLSWLYVHGTLPPDMLDHVNRDPTDNRLSNLRLATRSENAQNQSMRSDNTSGHVGVRWHKRNQKWMAHIGLKQKHIHLGSFTDLSEAIAARKAAEIQYHTFQHNQGTKP